jgi:hypothetical protein
MANAFLNTVITDSAISHSNFSRKIKRLSKQYVNANTKNFHELVKQFSPAEQRFWCLIRMKHAMETIMDKKPTYLYVDIVDRLKLAKKPSDSVNDDDFKDLIEDYAEKVIEFLEQDENENENLIQKKTDLLNELNIQKSEFRKASKQNKKNLIIKGLICLALSTASVVIVTAQGAMCAVLSIPTALLVGSYGILAHELDPMTALRNALLWVKHISENKQANGLAAIFIFGVGYFNAIKPDPFLSELFKIAQDILPTCPKPILGMASAAAVPPLYFLRQYKKYRTNNQMMDNLFENQDIKDAKNQRLGAAGPN